MTTYFRRNTFSVKSAQSLVAQTCFNALRIYIKLRGIYREVAFVYLHVNHFQIPSFKSPKVQFRCPICWSCRASGRLIFAGSDIRTLWVNRYSKQKNVTDTCSVGDARSKTAETVLLTLCDEQRNITLNCLHCDHHNFIISYCLHCDEQTNIAS